MVPISQEQLKQLAGAMLVYKQFLQRRIPSSQQRARTQLVQTFLIPTLLAGLEPHEGEMPLLLTVDEVLVMKRGLAILSDQLKCKPATRSLTQEITHQEELKRMLDQHFRSTQDDPVE